MKKRLTAILTVMALMLTGCAGNVTSGTESQPTSDVQSDISDNESSDTSSAPENDASRYEIITATEMAEKMGLGISLGNTMEAYEATDCEKITYEWIPVVGGNEPQDYETCWGSGCYHAGNNRRYEGGRLQHSSYSCVLGQYDGK